MAVDEQKLRRSLHDPLESALGADEAALLMDYLPPVGWADVARQQDIEMLRSEMRSMRTDLLAEITDLKSSLLMWLIPTWIASTALAVTLAKVI